MAEPKFTPAPWRFDYGDSFDHHEDGEANGFEILMDGANPRETGRCQAIHRIRYAEEVFPDDACREEAEANARLIAAAPELYEALVDLHAAVHGGGFPHEAVKRAEAALAKVHGE